ncbi:UPF0481 protein At3g47200-like [Solanum pennellii]|uniref:UPF0481 protein At3g47200-like n=1 Tax=Solanum pennellii TaxID=28526 RepID=A0ABM1G4H7_SOLPN|nr:UPF0481 protein At3g47200-like [Solanum pennellii]
MVAVFNKDLLSWYLITLKLKETVDAGLQNTPTTPTPTPTTSRSISFPEFPLQQQQQHRLLQKEEYHPADSLKITIEENVHTVEEGPKSPESEWVISIKDKLEQAKQDNDAGSWAKLSIYRVPLSLRRDDDKAYIPQIVSLGPYHHGKKRLRNMDRHKWRAVLQILKRTDQEIKMYIDAVRELEEKARACYEGTIAMNSNEFVEMMVLDSCFVLELFRGVAGGFQHLGYARNDPVFAMRGSMHSIQRDMIMIENQIPLFILDRLYGIQSDMPHEKGIVARLALRFFDPLMPTDEPLTKSDLTKLESSMGRSASFDPLADLAGLHCLDVFRRSLLQTGPKPTPRTWIKRWSHSSRVADKRRQQMIHSVSELKEAGVKFKKRKTDRFWDVKFKKGILKMPRLLIHDGTKSLFLNLIAFEQCHLDCTNDITSYVIFLDNLIDSPEDVKYLHYCGIIEHWLGNDAEVADLFNRLCQEVVFDVNDSYLSQLSEQINRYYDHRWNAWRATLRHKYFNNPWAIISFAAAVILIIFTFAQTFYGVYGYYRPPQ